MNGQLASWKASAIAQNSVTAAQGEAPARQHFSVPHINWVKLARVSNALLLPLAPAIALLQHQPGRPDLVWTFLAFCLAVWTWFRLLRAVKWKEPYKFRTLKGVLFVIAWYAFFSLMRKYGYA
jgi:hypothetical protein